MKTLTVRLPETLVADIEAESRRRNVSKSNLVRERLELGRRRQPSASFAAVADLVGSVRDLPPDLSARTKAYLRRSGYAKNRHR